MQDNEFKESKTPLLDGMNQNYENGGELRSAASASGDSASDRYRPPLSRQPATRNVLKGQPELLKQAGYSYPNGLSPSAEELTQYLYYMDMRHSKTYKAFHDRIWLESQTQRAQTGRFHQFFNRLSKGPADIVEKRDNTWRLFLELKVAESFLPLYRLIGMGESIDMDKLRAPVGVPAEVFSKHRGALIRLKELQHSSYGMGNDDQIKQTIIEYFRSLLPEQQAALLNEDAGFRDDGEGELDADDGRKNDARNDSRLQIRLQQEYSRKFEARLAQPNYQLVHNTPEQLRDKLVVLQLRVALIRDFGRLPSHQQAALLNEDADFWDDGGGELDADDEKHDTTTTFRREVSEKNLQAKFAARLAKEHYQPDPNPSHNTQERLKAKLVALRLQVELYTLNVDPSSQEAFWKGFAEARKAEAYGIKPDIKVDKREQKINQLKDQVAQKRAKRFAAAPSSSLDRGVLTLGDEKDEDTAARARRQAGDSSSASTAGGPESDSVSTPRGVVGPFDDDDDDGPGPGEIDPDYFSDDSDDDDDDVFHDGHALEHFSSNLDVVDFKPKSVQSRNGQVPLRDVAADSEEYVFVGERVFSARGARRRALHHSHKTAAAKLWQVEEVEAREAQMTRLFGTPFAESQYMQEKREQLARPPKPLEEMNEVGVRIKWHRRLLAFIKQNPKEVLLMAVWVALTTLAMIALPPFAIVFVPLNLLYVYDKWFKKDLFKKLMNSAVGGAAYAVVVFSMTLVNGFLDNIPHFQIPGLVLDILQFIGNPWIGGTLLVFGTVWLFKSFKDSAFRTPIDHSDLTKACAATWEAEKIMYDEHGNFREFHDLSFDEHEQLVEILDRLLAYESLVGTDREGEDWVLQGSFGGNDPDARAEFKAYLQKIRGFLKKEKAEELNNEFEVIKEQIEEQRGLTGKQVKAAEFSNSELNRISFTDGTEQNYITGIAQEMQVSPDDMFGPARKNDRTAGVRRRYAERYGLTAANLKTLPQIINKLANRKQLRAAEDRLNLLATYYARLPFQVNHFKAANFRSKASGWKLLAAFVLLALGLVAVVVLMLAITNVLDFYSPFEFFLQKLFNISFVPDGYRVFFSGILPGIMTVGMGLAIAMVKETATFLLHNLKFEKYAGFVSRYGKKLQYEEDANRSALGSDHKPVSTLRLYWRRFVHAATATAFSWDKETGKMLVFGEDFDLPEMPEIETLRMTFFSPTDEEKQQMQQFSKWHLATDEKKQQMMQVSNLHLVQRKGEPGNYTYTLKYYDQRSKVFAKKAIHNRKIIERLNRQQNGAELNDSVLLKKIGILYRGKSDVGRQRLKFAAVLVFYFLIPTILLLSGVLPDSMTGAALSALMFPLMIPVMGLLNAVLTRIFGQGSELSLLTQLFRGFKKEKNQYLNEVADESSLGLLAYDEKQAKKDKVLDTGGGDGYDAYKAADRKKRGETLNFRQHILLPFAFIGALIAAVLSGSPWAIALAAIGTGLRSLAILAKATDIYKKYIHVLDGLIGFGLVITSVFLFFDAGLGWSLMLFAPLTLAVGLSLVASSVFGLLQRTGWRANWGNFGVEQMLFGYGGVVTFLVSLGFFIASLPLPNLDLLIGMGAGVGMVGFRVYQIWGLWNREGEKAQEEQGHAEKGKQFWALATVLGVGFLILLFAVFTPGMGFTRPTFGLFPVFADVLRVVAVALIALPIVYRGAVILFKEKGTDDFEEEEEEEIQNQEVNVPAQPQPEDDHNLVGRVAQEGQFGQIEQGNGVGSSVQAVHAIPASVAQVGQGQVAQGPLDGQAGDPAQRVRNFPGRGQLVDLDEAKDEETDGRSAQHFFRTMPASPANPIFAQARGYFVEILNAVLKHEDSRHKYLREVAVHNKPAGHALRAAQTATNAAELAVQAAENLQRDILLGKPFPPGREETAITTAVQKARQAVEEAKLPGKTPVQRMADVKKAKKGVEEAIAATKIYISVNAQSLPLVSRLKFQSMMLGKEVMQQAGDAVKRVAQPVEQADLAIKDVKVAAGAGRRQITDAWPMWTEFGVSGARNAAELAVQAAEELYRDVPREIVNNSVPSALKEENALGTAVREAREAVNNAQLADKTPAQIMVHVKEANKKVQDAIMAAKTYIDASVQQLLPSSDADKAWFKKRLLERPSMFQAARLVEQADLAIEAALSRNGTRAYKGHEAMLRGDSHGVGQVVEHKVYTDKEISAIASVFAACKAPDGRLRKSELASYWNSQEMEKLRVAAEAATQYTARHDALINAKITAPIGDDAKKMLAQRWGEVQDDLTLPPLIDADGQPLPGGGAFDPLSASLTRLGIGLDHVEAAATEIRKTRVGVDGKKFKVDADGYNLGIKEHHDALTATANVAEVYPCGPNGFQAAQAADSRQRDATHAELGKMGKDAFTPRVASTPKPGSAWRAEQAAKHARFFATHLSRDAADDDQDAADDDDENYLSLPDGDTVVVDDGVHAVP